MYAGVTGVAVKLVGATIARPCPVHRRPSKKQIQRLLWRWGTLGFPGNVVAGKAPLLTQVRGIERTEEPGARLPRPRQMAGLAESFGRESCPECRSAERDRVGCYRSSPGTHIECEGRPRSGAIHQDC